MLVTGQRKGRETDIGNPGPWFPYSGLSESLCYSVLYIGICLTINVQQRVLKLKRKSLETRALVSKRRSGKRSCSNVCWQWGMIAVDSQGGRGQKHHEEEMRELRHSLRPGVVSRDKCPRRVCSGVTPGPSPRDSDSVDPGRGSGV